VWQEGWIIASNGRAYQWLEDHNPNAPPKRVAKFPADVDRWERLGKAAQDVLLEHGLSREGCEAQWVFNKDLKQFQRLKKKRPPRKTHEPAAPAHPPADTDAPTPDNMAAIGLGALYAAVQLVNVAAELDALPVDVAAVKRLRSELALEANVEGCAITATEELLSRPEYRALTLVKQQPHEPPPGAFLVAVEGLDGYQCPASHRVAATLFRRGRNGGPHTYQVMRAECNTPPRQARPIVSACVPRVASDEQDAAEEALVLIRRPASAICQHCCRCPTCECPCRCPSRLGGGGGGGGDGGGPGGHGAQGGGPGDAGDEPPPPPTDAPRGAPGSTPPPDAAGGEGASNTGKGPCGRKPNKRASRGPSASAIQRGTGAAEKGPAIAKDRLEAAIDPATAATCDCDRRLKELADTHDEEMAAFKQSRGELQRGHEAAVDALKRELEEAKLAACQCESVTAQTVAAAAAHEQQVEELNRAHGEEMDALKQDYEKLQRARDAIVDTLGRERVDATALANRCESAAAQAAAAAAARDKQVEELTRVHGEQLEALKRQHEGLQRDHRAAIDALERAREEAKLVTGQRDSATAQAAAAAAAHDQQVKELTRASEERLEGLTRSHDSVVNELRRKLTDADAQLASLYASAGDQLTAAAAEGRLRRDELTREHERALDALRQGHAKAHSSHDAAMNTLRRELEDVTTQGREAEGRRVEAEARLTTERESATAQATMAAAEHNRRISEVERAHRQTMDALQGKLTQARAECTTAVTQKDAIHAERDRIRALLDEERHTTMRENKRGQELNDRVRQLEAQIEELMRQAEERAHEADHACRRTELEAAQARKEFTAKLDAVRIKAESDLHTERMRAEESERSLRIATEKHLALSEELAAAHRRAASAPDAAAAERRYRAEIEALKTERERGKEMHASEVLRHDATRQSMRLKVDALEAKIAEHMAAAASAQHTSDALQQELTEARFKAQERAQEVFVAQQQRQLAEQEVRRLTDRSVANHQDLMFAQMTVATTARHAASTAKDASFQIAAANANADAASARELSTWSAFEALRRAPVAPPPHDGQHTLLLSAAPSMGSAHWSASPEPQHPPERVPAELAELLNDIDTEHEGYLKHARHADLDVALMAWLRQADNIVALHGFPSDRVRAFPLGTTVSSAFSLLAGWLERHTEIPTDAPTIDTMLKAAACAAPTGPALFGMGPTAALLTGDAASHRFRSDVAPRVQALLQCHANSQVPRPPSIDGGVESDDEGAAESVMRDASVATRRCAWSPAPTAPVMAAPVAHSGLRARTQHHDPGMAVAMPTYAELKGDKRPMALEYGDAAAAPDLN
jgi:hypothetical protein